MIPDGVVIDARTASPEFPGIGRYVLGLTRALATIERASGPARVTLLTTTAPSARLPPLAMLPTGASPFDLRQQWQVPRALRRAGARLYHSPYYLMPYAPGAPAVVNCYDMIPLAVPGLFGPAARLAFRVAHILAFRASVAIIVPSEATRADVERFFPASARKVVVVPAGAEISARLFAEEARALRQSLNLPARYVLYVGSNKPHKNVPLLAVAWARAIRQCPAVTRGVQLVVAGPNDPRYPRADAVADDHGAGGRVSVLGQVDDRVLSALYAGAALFAFPSQCEGFGLPVVEAMAHGAPVVCGDTPALAELAGGAAAMCPTTHPGPLAETIVRLLGDEGEAARLREAGRARSAGFTWDRTARGTTDVYRRILGEGAGMIGASR